MGWARFNKKEIPYLITILVAIVGWSITHVADRVLKAPVVEYETKIDTTKEPRTIRVTILNLSNKAFLNLRFELQGKTVKACNIPMSFEPPAWASNLGPDEGTDGVGFVVSQLQPNWKVTICGVYTAGGKEPLFVLKDGGRDQSIELRQSGLATWIRKHEVNLLLVFASIGLLGIGAWIVFGRETE